MVEGRSWVQRSWTPGNYVPKPNEELYGTWTNTTEVGKMATRVPQKEIHSPGEVQTFERLSDKAPSWEATEQIDTKWTDSDGNVWYKTFGTITLGWMKGYKSQKLIKISKSGTMLEAVETEVAELDSSLYPSRITDSNDVDYYIFYRNAEK